MPSVADFSFDVVCKILEKNGFIMRGSPKGSHFIYVNKATGVALSIPRPHKKKNIAPPTMSNIIRQSGQSREWWFAQLQSIDKH